MAANRDFLSNNGDILARSAAGGVLVQYLSETDTLEVTYAYYADVDTYPVGDDLFLHVEHETGRIGGCTVYDYRRGLFARQPLLADLLRRYEAQPGAAQAEWGLRLFHSLLAVASPDLADLIETAYTAPEDLAAAPDPAVRRQAIRSLQAWGREALAAGRGLLRRLAADTDQAVRRLTAGALAQINVPVAQAATRAAGGLPGYTIETLPGRPRVQLIHSEDRRRFGLKVRVTWLDDPQFDPGRAWVVTLATAAPAPAGLAWAEWVVDQVLVQPLNMTRLEIDIPLVSGEQALDADQEADVRLWFDTLTCDLAPAD